MVRDAGYTVAVSTAPGASAEPGERFEMRRFAPWDATRARFYWNLAQNLARRPVSPLGASRVAA